MTADVVPHPSVPRVGYGTAYGSAVVVAPWLTHWVAWLKVPSGWTILERTPMRSHAVDDGLAYAKLRALPFTVQSAPIAVERAEGGSYVPSASLGRGGEVYIAPDEHGGGCWAVHHTSRSGDSETLISRHLGFDRAVEAARDAAHLYGATFDEGPSEHPQGAA